MMKRSLQIFGIWFLSLMIFLTGCEMKQAEEAEKKDVEFTVVEPDEVPAELSEIIEKNKQGEMKLTYEDQGYTYLVRGYGQQKTGRLQHSCKRGLAGWGRTACGYQPDRSSKGSEDSG